MVLQEIKPDYESLFQSISLTLTVSSTTKRVNLELRYLYKTDMWYTSLYDVETGEAYLTYVPLLASLPGEFTNLWEQYWYKRIGMLACIPAVDNPKTTNPSKDNLNEFAIVWSDGIADE